MAFVNVSRLKVKEPRKGWKGRFFHSDSMTFAYYTIAAGATIHPHSHENDEVWNVIDGELEVTLGSRKRRVRAGGAVVVPPHTTHAIRALKATRAIVVDHPTRDSIGDIAI